MVAARVPSKKREARGGCLEKNPFFDWEPVTRFEKWFSVFSSVQDGIYALGKAHMRSTLCLGGFPNVAYGTVPTFV